MLQYKLEKEENGEKIYLYFPEGNENAPGKISFKHNGIREILEESSEDLKRIYAMHALAGINTSKKEGAIAWY